MIIFCNLDFVIDSELVTKPVIHYFESGCRMNKKNFILTWARRNFWSISFRPSIFN